jgi:vancomycin permeability regulator SanA
VVNRSVAPFTMVQGNPAVPVAQCGIVLGTAKTVKEFTRSLRPLANRASKSVSSPDAPGYKAERRTP